MLYTGRQNDGLTDRITSVLVEVINHQDSKIIFLQY